ncbi:L,D-transpeptidase [Geobacter sp.]|uniref:L,D-transpeptidase n=1 Tax=Geobacter sp. TaxID=46610 RepID=UPI002614D37E|nr:L,D-transpeptidase [Geobacter sp.]
MLRLLLFGLLLLPSLTARDAAAEDPKKILNLCTIDYPSDATVAWECHRLKPGETAETLFGDSWRDVLRFNRVDRRHLSPGVSLKVPKNLEDVADFTPMPRFYPEAENEAKFLLVDLSEQFLGAYEFGRLVHSFPIASGDRENPTPTGDFRITAFDRRHASTLYKIEKTDIPYPMHYALRFFVNRRWVSFWLHGRDVPGFPASHGCIGLYDEEMQKRYYHFPREPLLQDARILYEWVVSPLPDSGGFTPLREGPRLRIVGEPPL